VQFATLLSVLITDASGTAGVARVISFSLTACTLRLCVMVRSVKIKRLEVGRNTSRPAVPSRLSACTDPEVTRSKVKVIGLSSVNCGSGYACRY